MILKTNSRCVHSLGLSTNAPDYKHCRVLLQGTVLLITLLYVKSRPWKRRSGVLRVATFVKTKAPMTGGGM